jgi:hypothetical protein
MIDAFAYAVAAQEASLRDKYLLLYLRSKPWWIPEPLYHWFLNKLVVLAMFKK